MGIEFEGLPMDIRSEGTGHLLQRPFQLFVADNAPWAHHIRHDIDTYWDRRLRRVHTFFSR